MAHSVQEFRGKYVALNDLDIVAFIAVVHAAMERVHDADNHLNTLQSWDHQLKVAGPGSLDLMLDEIIQSSEDKERFLDMLQKARAKIEAFGDVIPATVLHCQTGMGATLKDYPSDLILAVVDKLREIVR